MPSNIKNIRLSWIDCVNINLVKDTKLFINPYMFWKGKDEYSKKANIYYKSFCDELNRKCLNWNLNWISKMLGELKEFKYWRLWFSQKSIHWKWNWEVRCKKLYKEITSTRIDTIIKRWINFTDLFWVISELWADCISDAVWNIIVDVLITFTNESLRKSTKKFTQSNFEVKYWSVSKLRWMNKIVNLPIDESWKPFLLTPTNFVTSSYQLSPDRLIEELFIKHKDWQDRLYGIWIQVELEKGKKWITNKDRMSKIKKFWKSVKKILQMYLVKTPIEFAKAKKSIIKRTRSNAKKYKLNIIDIKAEANKKHSIKIKYTKKKES